jgi:hypothetical protein
VVVFLLGLKGAVEQKADSDMVFRVKEREN